MKSIVKTVKGRGRPKGSRNKPDIANLNESISLLREKSELNKRLIDELERDLEQKDYTIEIMRDEIAELKKEIKDQKENNALLELDSSHLKDIIKRLVEHL